MSKKNPRNPLELRDAKMVLRILSMLALSGGAVLALGLAFHSQSGLTVATGLLWAAAAASAGALAGFLFGIPRVLQADVVLGAPQEEGDEGEDNGAAGARYQVNTNLEQISDWLTKIIVGLGLIELRRVPGAIQSLGEYFAGSVPGQNLEAIGGAIVVYFGVLGFLVGYLATRLYLAGAFSRADRLMDLDGVEMTGEQVAHQRSALLTDMLKTLSSIVRAGGRGALAQIQGRGLDEKPRSVLWVDDNPSNNGVLIKNLKDQGIVVSLVGSTEQAPRAFEQGRRRLRDHRHAADRIGCREAGSGSRVDLRLAIS